jgi:hypothetical protein
MIPLADSDAIEGKQPPNVNGKASLNWLSRLQSPKIIMTGLKFVPLT